MRRAAFRASRQGLRALCPERHLRPPGGSTAAALWSNTTALCPCARSRRTMLAPIRPRPIIPICMPVPLRAAVPRSIAPRRGRPPAAVARRAAPAPGIRRGCRAPCSICASVVTSGGVRVSTLPIVVLKLRPRSRARVHHGLGREFRRRLGVAVDDEVEAEQEAAAAHVADQCVALLHLVEAIERQRRRRARAFSTSPSSSMISIVVSAARQVTGFFSCV